MALVGFKLEVRAKIREAVNYFPNLVYLGLIVTEVIVWFSGQVARDRGLTSWSGYSRWSIGGCRLWVGVQFLYVVWQ